LPFSFKDNRPGKKWVHAFLKRNKEHVVIRKPTNIRRCRAAVSPAQIRAYFANLEKEVQGVPPSHIFNCDESCMRDDPSAKSAFFKKGVRYPEQENVYIVLFIYQIPVLPVPYCTVPAGIPKLCIQSLIGTYQYCITVPIQYGIWYW
jgi:hypothetical protein